MSQTITCRAQAENGNLLQLNTQSLGTFTQIYPEMKSTKIAEKTEEISEKFIDKFKPYLPSIARICLCATFIEDSLRMITQFSDQTGYMKDQLGSRFLGVLFVIFNFLTQITGSVLILSKKSIQISTGLLFASIFGQIFAYSVWTETAFLMRSFSLFGAVFLMLAEHWSSSQKNIFTQNIGFQDENHTKKNVVILSGRVLLTLMFLSMMHFDSSLENGIKNVVGVFIMGMIALGYKTKSASFVMICWLSLINFWFNAFWMHTGESLILDFKKFDFFQTMTVIGGLFTLILIGPGEMSLEELKKDI